MNIQNGDHAQYEIENAGIPPEQRSDWPLSSFDAREWGKAFLKANPGIDLDTMTAWFANALMRGYDEAMSRRPK